MAEASASFVTFALGEEELAVDLEHVREIVACGPITRVPSVPSFLRGVTHLRGAALPVVDLADKFGFGALSVTRWTCILVLHVTARGEPLHIGVLVDAVHRLVTCAPDDIAPVPPLGTSVRPEFLLGLLRADDRFCFVVDIERVLSEGELAAVTSIDAP